MTYHIQSIAPGVVRVDEHEASYPVTKVEAESNLAQVQASRNCYGCVDDWLRRVTFYEDILEAMGAR